jgi:hypothetical protein
MKTNFKSFISGAIVTTVIFAIATTALAATGTVNFSTVNIKVGDKQVASAGDTYTLSNGAQAPYSISYSDTNGGSTTYVPIRKFSELVGVDVGWDSSSGSVTVGKKDDSASTTTTSSATTSTTSTTGTASGNTATSSVTSISNYSDFKAMFSKITVLSPDNGWSMVCANYSGDLTRSQVIQILKQLSSESLTSYMLQYANEIKANQNLQNVELYLYDDKPNLANIKVKDGVIITQAINLDS